MRCVINITSVRMTKGVPCKLVGVMGFADDLDGYFKFKWKKKKRSKRWKLMIDGNEVESPDHFGPEHWKNRKIVKWMFENRESLRAIADAKSD